MTNIPKLRFKEFTDNWEEKPYGDIYSFYTTNSLSREKLNYTKGIVKNIHYGDIHTKFSTLFDISNENVPFINDDINLSKIKIENYCQVGDLVIADASEDYADIGKTIEIINLNKEKLLAGLHTFLARPNKHKMSLGFAGYLLQSNKVRKQVMKIAQGTKVLSISTGRLSNIDLNIPKPIEQEKISSFLTSINTRVAQLKKNKVLLEQYKKGVMQKIFSQEIRFKDSEGGNFPDWEEKKLSDVFKERKSFSTKGNQYPHISLTKKGVVAKSERYERDFLVGDDTIKKYKITYLNDICYNPANLKFGVICRNTFGKGIFSPIYVTFEVINSHNIQFMEYFVTRLDFVNMVRKYEEGTVYERQAVKADDFLRFNIAIPKIEEQKVIASFLTTLDKKLEHVKNQYDNMTKFQRFLIQQMFI